MKSGRNRAVAAVATLVLAAGFSTSGCSGDADVPGVATAADQTDGDTGGTAALSEAEQQQRFLDCLVAEGVIVEAGGDGAPQVDKDRTTITTLGAATEACRAEAPSDDAPEEITAADLDQRRAQASCLRENGVPQYPDPDPETGAAELTEEVAAEIRSDPDFAAAMEQCRSVAPQPSTTEG